MFGVTDMRWQKTTDLLMISIVLMIILATACLATTRDELLARGRQAVDGFDLTGDYAMGIYARGGRNIGMMKLFVERPDAEDEGSDLADLVAGQAAYRIVSQRVMELQGYKFAGESEHFVDENLALCGFRTKDKFPDRERRWFAYQTGDRWVATRAVDEEVVTFELPAEAPNYLAKPVAWLLSRRLDLSHPDTFVLRGINLPSARETGMGLEYRDITVTIPPPIMFRFRGRTGPVRLVRYEFAGDETMVMAVTPQNRVLTVYSLKMPEIMMIAGTPEQITEDLYPPEDVAVLERVIKFCLVLSGHKPIELLDQIVDWEAVRLEMARTVPNADKLSHEEFALIMREALRQHTTDLSAETIELLGLFLEPLVQDDVATVSFPDRDGIFMLRKRNGEWIITHFPH